MGIKENLQKSCFVCGSVNTTPLFKVGRIVYVRCMNCNLMFILNMPSESYLKKIYSYKKNLNREINRLNPALLVFLKFSITKDLLSLLGKIINSSRAKSINNIKKPSKILDIGCGTGEFLLEMYKSGWDVYGLEPGDNLVNMSERKIGKGRVYKGYLETVNFRNMKFDVIAMWQVLEHIPNVEKSFKKINQVLHTKGILIIEVPHSGSLNLNFFKKNWTLLLTPQHIHFWSSQALEKLLGKNGYEIDRVEYPIHFPFVFFSSLVKSRKNLIYLAPILLPLSLIVSFLFTLLKKGDLIRVYATKK